MCKLRPCHVRTYHTSRIVSCYIMSCPSMSCSSHSLSKPLISHHVMSHDELFQYILSPMLNPVSCDKRRTLGMFRSDTFSLLLSPSKPQQAETPTSVAKTPVLIKKHTVNKYNKKLVSCGRRGRFEVNVSFQRRNNPPVRMRNVHAIHSVICTHIKLTYHAHHTMYTV